LLEVFLRVSTAFAQFQKTDLAGVPQVPQSAHGYAQLLGGLSLGHEFWQGGSRFGSRPGLFLMGCHCISPSRVVVSGAGHFPTA
jgi:hypothetical protein